MTQLRENQNMYHMTKEKNNYIALIYALYLKSYGVIKSRFYQKNLISNMHLPSYILHFI